MMCVEIVSYAVKVNDDLPDFFYPIKGLRTNIDEANDIKSIFATYGEESDQVVSF